MKKKFVWFAVALAIWPVRSAFISGQEKIAAVQPRNIVIFVFDGLRAGSVNEIDSPTMFWIRNHGVSFTNSHSLFPTFTTANASAIATGHGLGDTGDFSNTLWAGYPIYETGNFNLPLASPTPFIENDRVLADLSSHYNGNFLTESTLMTAAMNSGYNTAVVGKAG